jgi:hypothetical protein
MAVPVQELEVILGIGAPLGFGDDVIDVPFVAVPEEQSAPKALALKFAKSRKVTSLRGSVDPFLESEQVLLQGKPGQAVPAIIYWHGLNSISRLYHPDNRAHVSVSPGFPRGIGFLGNPTSRGIRLTPAPRGRAVERLLRSLPLFGVGRRDLLSAGLLVGCTAGKGQFPARFTMPFWAKPITRVGLIPMTAVTQVRVPSHIRLS